MKKYILDYDGYNLATVEIDESKALPFIKEMVDFWSLAAERLENHNGDYVRAWLEQLVEYIFFNRCLPKNQEGWLPFGEETGIFVYDLDTISWDADLVEINEVENS